MTGLFNSFASYSGLNESSSYVDEAALEEAMQQLEEVDDVEVNDDLMEACVQAAIANEQNLNMIMMSVANEEMNYFVENGVEMVYEEGKISAFFDKIKKFLKKAWEKIKSIFNKALEHIRSWISSDKKFVQKYGDEIKKYASDVKIEGYNVDGKKAADAKPYETVVDGAADYLGYIKNGDTTKVGPDWNADGIASLIRGKVTGQTGKKVSNDDMISWLKEHFTLKDKSSDFTYGGEDVYNELAKGNTTSKSVKAGYNAAKSAIAVMEANVKQAETVAKNTKKTEGTSYSMALSICSASVSIMNACQRIQLQAVNTYHQNCRKIAAKCVTKSKNKKSSNESFDFGSGFDALLV